MKPYYQDTRTTLYVGDCIDLLPEIGTVDSVVTDPPYNVGIQYGANVDDRKDDYEEWCAAWFDMLDAPRKAISCGVANMGMWQRMRPPSWWLCWHKPAAMGRCLVGFNNWEPIALWGKPVKQTVDVVTAPIVADRTVQGHPCPKPLKWGTIQVAMLTPEGGTVLDPFAGSGTVLLAAKETGRKGVGIEIEERYAEMVANRLRQEVLPLCI